MAFAVVVLIAPVAGSVKVSVLPPLRVMPFSVAFTVPAAPMVALRAEGPAFSVTPLAKVWLFTVEALPVS